MRGLNANSEGYIFSTILHCVVLILLIVPLSFSQKKNTLSPSKPIPFKIISVSDLTTSPRKKRVEKPQEILKKAQEVVRPIDKKDSVSQKETPVSSKPNPKPKKNSLNPNKDKMVSEKKQPEKIQETVKKSSKTQEKKKARKKQEDFLAVLQTVEALKSPVSEDDGREDAFDSDLIDDKLSLSELDALKQQLAKCWALPSGARGAEDLVVVVDVRVGADAIVKSAEIQDKSKMKDPFFKAAAESARRALYHPDCTPLRLPKDKFDSWQSFKITFNPREMFE